MKNKIIIGLSIGLCLSLLVGCQKLFLKPDEVGNEPGRNFELFWNDVDKTYPFFQQDKVDWQAVYEKYRPQVTESTSTRALAAILWEMMNPLMDGHRSITYNGESWSSFLEYSTRDRYNLVVLQKDYIKDVKIITQPDESNSSERDTVLILGRTIDNKYAYLGVRTYDTEINLVEEIAATFKQFGNIEGVIVDVRNNGGGRIIKMYDVMSLFTEFDMPYATYQPKIGPLKENLMPLNLLNGTDFEIPRFGVYAKKKNIFITSRVCFSAAEHTAMSAKRMGFLIVGDTTGGALSPVVEKTLPNGISYVLVNSRVLDVNKVSWERRGFPPTHPVKSSKEQFQVSDPFMDKALELLNK